MNQELTINDLKIVVQLIDLVTKRGALEGNEILQVGILREKLIATVKASEDKNSEAQEDITEEEDESEGED